MNIYEYMGNLSTKHSDIHSYYGTRIQPGNLKPESQKIVKFMGRMDEWKSFKSRMECAFDESVYKQVLIYATYSIWNTQMNRVVYSQWEVATVGGTAHHLIKKYEDDKNGYGAWNALC